MADYAGDVSAAEAWAALAADADAILIDVRTRPEWQFVGVPDLSSLDRQVAVVSWQVYPAMERNPQFEQMVKGLAASMETPLYFLCRSGVRSRAAAIAMTAAGYRRCYNVAGGFEGGLDEARHRGRREGWKVSDLPWVQE
ncbi:MAG: rhodanese-like domain-containing protein [Alphaproteobacteria bacterium]